MEDVMVTGRMSAQKKEQGNHVLERCGLNPSKAIGALYDRLIKDQNADFLFSEKQAPSTGQWESAFAYIDDISACRHSRFDAMSNAEIKADRLKGRGLL